MPDFSKLDSKHRLTPWSLKEHADYVTGQYGKMMAMEPEKANDYIEGYMKAEVASDESYEHQREVLRASSKAAGAEPQELPDLVKLEWDPRGKFGDSVKDAQKKEEAKATKLAEKEAAKKAKEEAKAKK